MSLNISVHNISTFLAEGLTNDGFDTKDVNLAITSRILLSQIDEEETQLIAMVLHKEVHDAVALNLARVVFTVGNNLGRLNRYNEAMVLYEQAEETFTKHGHEVDTAKCRMNQANTLQQLNRYPEALALFEQAEEIFTKHGHEVDAASCRMNRGVVLHELNRYPEALALYAQAEETFTKHGHEVNVANCRMNRAIVLDELNRYPEALALFEQAEEIFTKHGHEVDAASCRMNRGVVLHELNRYPEALTLYAQAEDILTRYGQEVEAARCRKIRANILQKLNRYPEALALYAQAEETFTKHGHKVDAAKCQMSRANVFQQLNKYSEAMTLYEQAEETFTKHGLEENAARCRGNHANILQELNRYPEAMTLYTQVEETFMKHGLEIDAATCRMNRGVVLQKLNRYFEAMTLYTQVEETFTKHGLEIDTATCRMNHGVVLQELNRYPEALTLYEQAEETFTKLGHKVDAAKCQMSRANVFQQLNKYPEALTLYEQAEETFTKHGHKVDAAKCQMSRANIVQEFNRYPGALTLYEQAEETFTKHGHEVGAADCRNNRAIVLKDLNRYTEALTLFMQAEETYTKHGLEKQTANCRNNRAIVLQEMNRYREALDLYEQAADTVCRIRETLSPDVGFGFLESAPDVFPMLVALLLKEGDFKEAWRRLEQSKGRTLFQMLDDHRHSALSGNGSLADVRTELVDLLNSDHRKLDEAQTIDYQRRVANVKARYIKAVSQGIGANKDNHPLDLPGLEKVQQCLAPGQAVLNFFAGNDNTTVFIATRDDLSVKSCPFSLTNAKRIYDEMARISDSLHQGKGHPAGLDGNVFHDLYTDLFAHLVPTLKKKGISQLYLVPHDLLHFIPLHAAFRWVGKHKQYLCDRFDIAYLPAASLLPLLKTYEPKLNPSFGTIVNPDLNRSPIPFTEVESVMLSRLFPEDQAEILYENQTDFKHLESLWGKTSWLHLSCHGGSDSFHPLTSYLKVGGEPGMLFGADIAYHLPRLDDTQLVILSSCETGAPYSGAVNEGLGLMTTLLASGARLILSPTWPVLEMAACLISHDFARNLLGGKSPSTAWSQALKCVREYRGGEPTEITQARQLIRPDTRKAYDQRYHRSKGDGKTTPLADLSHPFYWASFYLSGRLPHPG